VDIAETQLSSGAANALTALYAEHALGLVRLAVVLVGDQASAEDIVQDAFLGLYRRWDRLPDTSYPLAYVRVSVLNGCRTALRRRSRWRLTSPLSEAPAESAEARALLSEEQRAVAQALRRCRSGSGRRSCCATTSTCPKKRPPGPWASVAAPSSQPRPVRSPRSAGC
jgi:DNA-directed RNA polymerase specialized sigma24 family protein